MKEFWNKYKSEIKTNRKYQALTIITAIVVVGIISNLFI